MSEIINGYSGNQEKPSKPIKPVNTTKDKVHRYSGNQEKR